MKEKYIINNKKMINKNDNNYLRRKEAMTSFFLDGKYSPMTKKQLEKFFNVPDSEQYILTNILEDLENEALVYLDDSKRYVVADASKIVKCIYEAKSNKFGFGIIEDGEDVYISNTNLNGAMNKDEILVKIFRPSGTNRKKEGQVIKVLKRNTKKVIGKYIKNNNFGFVEPLDEKINDIYISKKNSFKYITGQVVEVEILKYPSNTSKAEGKITNVIGNQDTPNIEVKALYLSYGLDTMEKFPGIVVDEVKKISQEVKETDFLNRVDKTKERIYTIDGEDAKDLDDAVQVKKQGDTYTLSVFIADVSHYVKDGTNLDKEALNRGTSIYIPGTVIPMLPKELSNGICSLNAGVNRLALAIDIVFSNKGDVLESNIYKAVINVKKRMSYDKVYKVLYNEDEQVVNEYKEYVNDINIMRDLALILKAKRKQEGSIDFDIPDTNIVLDDNGMVVNIEPYNITITNNIIEEFMLAANMAVAQRFFYLDFPFIYRIHEKPDEERLKELNEILSNYKKRIKGIKNIHSKAFSDILDNIDDEEEKRIISTFMLRTLKLAKYSDECMGHFGLAAKFYCHFTSPIRRYPDLFIHRVISEYLDNGYNLSSNSINKYSKQAYRYAILSSMAEKQATVIERDFDDLYKVMYMSSYINEEFECVISNVTSFGIFIKLENTVEGLIPFENINDNDYYIYDEAKHRLIGKESSKIFKIGDKLRVKLVRADIKSKQLDFKMI